MTKIFNQIETLYCSGCYYNLINKLICEVIEELNIENNSVMIYSEGCSSLSKNYINIESINSSNGLAIPIALGIKDVDKQKFVFTYQGDGSILSYSIDSLINVAYKRYPITVIMINNFIMAGNLGFLSNSTPIEIGKNFYKEDNYNLDIINILKSISEKNYILKLSVHDNESIKSSKKFLKKAFEFQINNKGFSFVEFLSNCPTFWNKTPLESREFIKKHYQL